MDERSKGHRRILQEVEVLLSMISAPVLVVNQHGVVIHANTVAENVWGRSLVTLIDKSLDELTDTPTLHQYVRQGKPAMDLQIKINHSSGTQHAYLCKVHPLLVEKEAEGAVLSLTRQLVEEPGSKKEQKNAVRYSFASIRGNSQTINQLKGLAKTVAKSDSTILIRGESGTGKEVLAQAIHDASNRYQGPFVAINCAAIPESLLESELFGFEEGAFTGAKKGGKPGKFEMARGGTLFLDEIGDMPLYLQAKLLRVLQERRVERIGGSVSIPIDVRLMAATHKDVEAMIIQQQFREDLYFRLNVIPLHVPPLRERKEDLFDLIDFFMKSFSERLWKEPKRLSSQVVNILYAYHWPGNIRELENVVEYMVNLEAGELVTVTSVPAHIRTYAEAKKAAWKEEPEVRLSDVNIVTPTLSKLNGQEVQLIREALRIYGETTEGKKKAAEHLGISVSTLYRRLYKLNRERTERV